MTTQPAHARSAPDLGLQVPRTWSRRSDLTRSILVAARATTVPPSGRRPDLTLRCLVVDSSDLTSWRGTVLAELSARLDDFALEDDDDFDLFGHEVAYRRFAYRDPLHNIICDQWAWLHAGLGIMLTCTVAHADYADFCDLFETIAESVDRDGLGV